MNKKHILGRLPNTAFLCGSNCSDSMRNAFLKHVKSTYKDVFITNKDDENIFSDKRIILAEQIETLWEKCLKEENAGYNNLFEFEMEIAELSSVIPIFLEGHGALVETGAFFCNPKLKKKLLIIVDEKHCKKNSFIKKAILEDIFLKEKERIIYYDQSNESHKEKVFKEIFNFRNKADYNIEINTNNLTSLYFFLIGILCEWKTKEEIYQEVKKDTKLTKYIDKLDNHLKMLKAFKFIVEETDFNQTKYLSLIRSDSSILNKMSILHHTIIQTEREEESDLILLKYIKNFISPDCFSYSQREHYKEPDENLKSLQKILKTRILDCNHIFPVHTSATAYIKKNSIRRNIERHQKNQFLLKLDFKNFFSSIKRSDFLKYLESKNHFKGYKKLICDIVFKDNSLKNEDYPLPIGSSTSPVISNILLYSFDENIFKYSENLGITYSRYGDDLTFSYSKSNQLNVLEQKVKDLLKEIPYPLNLKINNKKTFHMSKKGQRKITGLYLTPEGKISLGRSRKNYIKKLLRDYEKNKHQQKIRHIQGYLCFIKNSDREFWNRLHDKYITNYQKETPLEFRKFYPLFYRKFIKKKKEIL